MRTVPIAPVANQSFTITLDGVRWGVVIKQLFGVMCVDIARNGDLVLSGTRVLAGEPLIPYKYLETGNFLLLTKNDNLPNYQNFGKSQFLVYLSVADISAIPTITVGQFFAGADKIEYLTSDDGFYLTTDNGELLTDD